MQTFFFFFLLHREYTLAQSSIINPFALPANDHAREKLRACDICCLLLTSFLFEFVFFFFFLTWPSLFCGCFVFEHNFSGVLKSPFLHKTVSLRVTCYERLYASRTVSKPVDQHVKYLTREAMRPGAKPANSCAIANYTESLHRLNGWINELLIWSTATVANNECLVPHTISHKLVPH